MGKKLTSVKEKIETGKEYSLEDAVNLIKETSFAKFDETVDLAINLGVDPRKSEQMVRGTVAGRHSAAISSTGWRRHRCWCNSQAARRDSKCVPLRARALFTHCGWHCTSI